MKTRVKAAVAVALVLCGGMVFGVGAQINLTSGGGINLVSGLPMQTINMTAYEITSGSRYMYINVGTLARIDGNLRVTGNETVQGNHSVWGIKSFIHPHPTDDSKVIRYISAESGEPLTLARGTAKTANGEAIISLPEHFSMVTSKDDPITVVLTPEGAPVLLYVKQKSREQITVAMKKSDFAEFRDVEFSYQVTGVRDGFEKQDVIVSVDDLSAPFVAREDVQKRMDALKERIEARDEAKMEVEK